MRTLLVGLALATLAACGDSTTGSAVDSVAGTWALQTYNGSALPYTGTVNTNGSVDRVDSGSIAFDGKATYVLSISIVNTLGGTTTNQSYAEVGSYSGSVATGLTLKPNDLSGGTSNLTFAEIPVTIAGNKLSFSQNGKILTFVKR